MKKNYENRSRFYLTRRTPVILRLDGKAFHTLTKNCDKPFDHRIRYAMMNSALETMNHLQGAKLAYIQSDEISILLTDYDKLNTEAWFDYNIQKMTSVAASICSVQFAHFWKKPAYFDCRVFNIPVDEVCNYFIWRQQDWTRNSLQMLARSHYSHQALQEKNSDDIHEMLHKKNINWADLPPCWKNGTVMIHSSIQAGDIIFNSEEGRWLVSSLLEPSET